MGRTRKEGVREEERRGEERVALGKEETLVFRLATEPGPSKGAHCACAEENTCIYICSHCIPIYTYTSSLELVWGFGLGGLS